MLVQVKAECLSAPASLPYTERDQLARRGRRVGLRSLSLPSTTWKVQYVVLQYYRWYNGTY